ncbi:hypothetical protein CS022_15260 [Veronia nyctiphanis]|uniref:Methyl-accepting chemotaxis protein n=1 Tax=Veronia nyctiphanis TaxID=1278244 RepID=A0A4Q0YTP9_9GAMM|nr:methyl-accepting chemotaxis protein [Veronia nyctiphanis]RXJ72539.1 hypothetical protein CS022_15260 [Veronia nyctiphanis]
MKWITNLSVKTKLLALVMLSVAGLAILTVDHGINAYQDLVAERKQKLKDSLDIALGMLDEEYSLSESDEQRALAVAKLGRLTYGNNGYYFAIEDTNRVLVGAKSWIGRDFSGFRDINGQHVMANMRDAIKNTGEGFTSYHFFNPASQQNAEKVSALVYYRPWNLLIGTGMYLDDIETMVWKNAISSVIVAVLISGILLACALWLTRTLLASIYSVQTALEEMAGGNLAIEAQVSSKDELGIMAEDFNRATSQLRALVESIKATLTELDNDSDNIVSLASHSNEGIHHQSIELDAVASAMEEMSCAVTIVETNTQTTSENTQRSTSLVREAEQSLADSVQQFEELNSDVHAAEENIRELAASSDQISDVVTVINTISEQTNLLALNAAIEAARAGDAGRGFAVVAAEVRKLAHSTKESTTQINAIIETVQDRAQSAAKIMTKGTNKTAQSLEQVRETQALLGSVATLIDDLDRMNCEVAASASQQAMAAKDAAKNVVTVHDVSKDNLAACEETLALSDKIKVLSSRSREELGRFTV